MKFLILMAAVGMLAGCASGGGRCSGDFDYQQAQTLPPAQVVEGIKTPDSASALRIPPEPATKVPFAETYQNPEDPSQYKTRCLDVPPRAPDPAPAEAAPAAAVKPAEPAKP